MDRALVVALICLGVAACVLALRLRRSPTIARVDPSDFGLQSPSGRAVALFSSPYCLTCQQWARELSAAEVAFTQVDVAAQPALAARYDVTATPVVLVFDRSDGAVVWSCSAGPTEAHHARVQALLSSGDQTPRRPDPAPAGQSAHHRGHESV